MSRRRQRRGAHSESSLPDPARALDQFDDWLRARLPAEPRPVWAQILLFVVGLVIGRGSWIVGAFLVVMSAPWFVFPYRQIETMTLAAWYRATATATATARVERAGVRLFPASGDGTVRAQPFVILAFEPSGSDWAASETLRVRYLPHGQDLEPFFERALDDDLVHSPPSYSSNWRLRWVDPATLEPSLEVRFDAEHSDLFAAKTTWNESTFLEDALDSLDRPADLMIGDWLRGPRDDLDVPIRFRPSRPDRVFVGNALARLPPTFGGGFGEIFSSTLFMGIFGLPFWWVGTRLLGRSVPPRHRHFIFWVPLALLPFWGTRYLAALERLSPDGNAFNVLAQKMGSTQVLPGSEPLGAVKEAPPERLITLETSRFAPVLRHVDLTRPGRPLADANAVWRDVSQRFVRGLTPLDDELWEKALRAAFAAEVGQSYSGLVPILVEAAAVVSLDQGRSESAREWARAVLSSATTSTGFDLCHPAFPAYQETIMPLTAHPDPGIAANATEWIKQRQEWIAQRQRDWGKIC